MSPALRPLFVTFLILILMLLFCSISITASDFFCPNLATIADYLGLSETTAGVTLLAFGNGSPDVFSTFVSVREGTFGLAVGELIGAASFITSIVVGSIAMVQPFHVPRFAFVRDIAFFTIAVLLLMLVLEDGKLTLRESGAMVALYACYVGVVVLHNWYSSRKRRAAEYAELGWKVGDEEVEVETDPAPPVPPPATVVESLVQLQPSTPITPKVRFPRRLSSASVVRAAESDEETAADTQRAGFSLLGAVEFRDVVNSLRRDPMTSPTSSRGGSRPSSPLPSPLVEHHHHDFSHQLRHHRRSSSQGIQVIEDSLSRRSSGPGRQRSGSLHPASATRPPPRFRTVSDSERLAAVPASPEPGPENNSLPMSPLPRRAESQPEVDKATLRVVIPPLELSDGGLSASPSSFDASRPPSGVASPLPPHISVVDPEGDMGSPIVPLTRTNTEATIGQHVSGIVHRVLHVLFPSLQGFKHKSVLGMALAILSAPSIFFLTLTLPVVDDGRGDEGGVALPGGEDDAFDTASVDSRRSSVDHSEIGEALHHHLVDGHNLRPRHAHFESSTIVRSGSPCPSSEYDVQSNVSDCDVLDFNPALAAAQCVFGPVLCCYLVFRKFLPPSRADRLQKRTITSLGSCLALPSWVQWPLCVCGCWQVTARRNLGASFAAAAVSCAPWCGSRALPTRSSTCCARLGRFSASATRLLV